MVSFQFTCCDSFHHLVECVRFLSFHSFSLYFQIVQPPFFCCENETASTVMILMMMIIIIIIIKNNVNQILRTVMVL